MLALFLAALLSFTIFNYVAAFAAVVLFYVFYTQPNDCTEHKVFISLNFIFCIIVSVVSILPKVQVMQTEVNMGICRLKLLNVDILCPDLSCHPLPVMYVY